MRKQVDWRGIVLNAASSVQPVIVGTPTAEPPTPPHTHRDAAAGGGARVMTCSHDRPLPANQQSTHLRTPVQQDSTWPGRWTRGSTGGLP